MIPFRLPAARSALPLGRGEGLPILPWLVALMVYMAGLSAVGLAVAGDAVRAAERSVGGRLTVQVPPETSAPRLQTVLALLRQNPAVQSAEVLSAEDTARLLEPWLGSPLALDELPVPKLIDVRLDPAGTADVATLRRQVASVVTDARLDDHRGWLGGVRAAASPLRAVLAGVLAVSLLLVAAAAAHAADAALRVRRSAVELFHLLGASDGDIVRPFALRALWQGLLGGATGSAAVLLTVAALGRSGGLVRLPAPVWVGFADWRLWAMLVGAVLAAGLLAMAGARLTVLRRLARLL